MDQNCCRRGATWDRFSPKCRVKFRLLKIVARTGTELNSMGSTDITDLLDSSAFTNNRSRNSRELPEVQPKCLKREVCLKPKFMNYLNCRTKDQPARATLRRNLAEHLKHDLCRCAIQMVSWVLGPVLGAADRTEQ